MTEQHKRHGEEGYLLVGLVVACFLVLLALAVAAPRMAKELERDREIESEHRALEYVRAIQLYYRKNNSFPTTVEQLAGSGTTGSSIGGIGQVKYLRQKYKDPLTNDEFRLIHVGEAQTQVKGFFGEPLDGAPIGTPIGGTVNPGAAATAIGGSTPGTSSGSGFSLGTPQVGTSPGTTSAGGATGTAAGAGTATSGDSSSSTTSGSSTNATTFQGSKGAVVGVGSNAKGPGLVEWNGSADISAWEFLYDPRVEMLKAKVSIFGGSPAANGSGSLGGGFAPIGGSTPGTSFGGSAPGAPGTGITGGTGTSGTGTTPTGTGTTPPTTPTQ